jgi:hypothetical protein
MNEEGIEKISIFAKNKIYMKKIVVLLLLGSLPYVANAQAYSGKGDKKFQVGATFQNGGNGITSTFDLGLGENMSIGIMGSYMLNAVNIGSDKAKFVDRADLKVRFNANLGKVIGLHSKMDLYPGLNLGTRNFGAHLGFRYFFSDGFGIFAETNMPLAKYKSEVVGFDRYNNQFVMVIGTSFNL